MGLLSVASIAAQPLVCGHSLVYSTGELLPFVRSDPSIFGDVYIDGIQLYLEDIILAHIWSFNANTPSGSSGITGTPLFVGSVKLGTILMMCRGMETAQVTVQMEKPTNSNRDPYNFFQWLAAVERQPLKNQKISPALYSSS